MDETSSQKEAATTFLRMVAAGEVREAYARFAGRGFRHHNPWFRGDADSLMQGMADNALANPDKRLEVKMAIGEGDRVAVLSHVRPQPQQRGVAVVHIFRFEHGRIVELWDVGQAISEDAVNELGMF